MAPKRGKRTLVEAAGSTDIQVKKEKEGVCIAGKSGATLANAVQYRINKKSCPGFIKSAYLQSVKYGKGMAASERKPLS